jgi:mono/diheme cytochrome c family protein
MALLLAASIVAAQSPSDHGSGMTPQERLAKPEMSDPPTQVELGHAEYWMSCMVCHGDRGQGLTEEWRTVLDPADMNCWQSRCHAPNHPPQGFEIPRTSPLIIGPGALTGYQTASDLFSYLRVYMPWSYPGLFEDDVYWNLTAYLADANGIELPQEPLGPDNGDQVLLLPQLVQTHHTAIKAEQTIAVAVVGLLLVAGVLYWWIRAL